MHVCRGGHRGQKPANLYNKNEEEGERGMNQGSNSLRHRLRGRDSKTNPCQSATPRGFMVDDSECDIHSRWFCHCSSWNFFSGDLVMEDI